MVPWPPATALAAVLVTLVALFSAFLIGQHRAKQRVAGSGVSWLLLYPFLFIISAMGTINIFLFVFEGRAVLQEDISSAIRSLEHFPSGANTVVSSRGYEAEISTGGYKAKLDELNQQLKILRNEVENPSRGHSCGFGTTANAELDKIKKMVGDLQLPSRMTTLYRDCHDRAQVQANEDAVSYIETTARKNLTEYWGKNERETFLKRISATNDQNIRLLQSVNSALTGVSGSADQEEAGRSGPVSNSRSGDPAAEIDSDRGLNDLDQNGRGSIRQAQHVLGAVALSYTRAFTQLHDWTNEHHEVMPVLPSTLNVDASLRLGSITAVVPMLLNRWATPTTYVYASIAIALDLALIFY